MIIIKRRDLADTWRVGHTSLTSWAYRLNLNEDAEEAINTGAFNSTAPTSTVFSIGTNTATNASGGTFVCYAFAPVAGYSAFGKYTGNGSTNGPFVYTGFRPKYVLIKKSTGAPNYWHTFDSVRNEYNSANKFLYPNVSDAEASVTAGLGIDILSNGFKIRNDSLGINGDTSTYVYAAFAEFPFKYTLAR